MVFIYQGIYPNSHDFLQGRMKRFVICFKELSGFKELMGSVLKDEVPFFRFDDDYSNVIYVETFKSTGQVGDLINSRLNSIMTYYHHPEVEDMCVMVYSENGLTYYINEHNKEGDYLRFVLSLN